jgi:hypothetical protein
MSTLHFLSTSLPMFLIFLFGLFATKTGNKFLVFLYFVLPPGIILVLSLTKLGVTPYVPAAAFIYMIFWMSMFKKGGMRIATKVLTVGFILTCAYYLIKLIDNSL